MGKIMKSKMRKAFVKKPTFPGPNTINILNRELAKKHHPDKVQNLGEVYVKAAKEKFSKIQAAYENIKKQRGI